MPQDPAHRVGVPDDPACRGRDAVGSESGGDAAQAHTGVGLLIDAPHDGRHRLVGDEPHLAELARTRTVGVPLWPPLVAVERADTRNKLAVLRTGVRGAVHAVLAALALHLSGERPRAEDHAPQWGILQLLGDELEADAQALPLVQQDRHVRLILGERVDVVGQHETEAARAGILTQP